MPDLRRSTRIRYPTVQIDDPDITPISRRLLYNSSPIEEFTDADESDSEGRNGNGHNQRNGNGHNQPTHGLTNEPDSGHELPPSQYHPFGVTVRLPDLKFDGAEFRSFVDGLSALTGPWAEPSNAYLLQSSSQIDGHAGIRSNSPSAISVDESPQSSPQSRPQSLPPQPVEPAVEESNPLDQYPEYMRILDVLRNKTKGIAYTQTLKWRIYRDVAKRTGLSELQVAEWGQEKRGTWSNISRRCRKAHQLYIEMNAKTTLSSEEREKLDVLKVFFGGEIRLQELEDPQAGAAPGIWMAHHVLQTALRLAANVLDTYV